MESVKQVRIASIVPPEDLEFDGESFFSNLCTKPREQPDVFLPYKERVDSGLSETVPKKVLVAVFHFEHKGESIRTSVTLDNVIIEAHEYSAFPQLPRFPQIKKGVEEIVQEYDRPHWNYALNPNVAFVTPETLPAKRIVSSLMILFDQTMSLLAYNAGLETLKLVDRKLEFGIHENARFRSPLRNGYGFVNAANLVAHIEERPIPFTLERLQEIVKT